MHGVRRRRAGREGAWLFGAFFVAALWATPRASASVFGPAVFSRLRAGSTETVHLGVAPPGVDERELVLSLDGGRTFPVRLTREIEPGDRMATWRVPALPTVHAVLALREGGEGLEEKIVATSAEFTIPASPAAPVEELRLRDGEWKTREADPGGSPLPPAGLGEAGSERVKPLEDSPEASEESAHVFLEAPGAFSLPVRDGALRFATGPTSTAPRTGRFLPLRE